MQPALSRLEPFFSPRIWGQRSLAPWYPEKANLKEPLGEAWLTAFDSRVSNGPFAGKTLREMWHAMPADWRGRRLASVAEFPVLIKFIFPNDKLSIQVHPGDAYAAKHEQAAGGRGKTEMWHLGWAKSGAEILFGLKPGVKKQEFLRSLADNSVENLLPHIPVQTGDTYFVPAGTQHAMGAGLVVCEVQEYSDLTYRVYDFARVDARGKLRELHVEKALQVMNFDKRASGRVPPLLLSTEGARRSLLAACRYFATERWECSVKCEIPVDPERFELIVILEGAGSFVWADSGARYRRSECWLVPALQGHVEVLPEAATSLIRTYVPDIPALRTELHRNGISAALAQVIFD